jgi:hypothetical protein
MKLYFIRKPNFHHAIILLKHLVTFNMMLFIVLCWLIRN